MQSQGRKFDQVIQGALRVFLRDGYEGASVDDIAQEAAVSKATLYSYFPDKRRMFIDSFSYEINKFVCDAGRVDIDALTLQASLEQLAERVIDYYLSDFALSVSRIVAAEASRFPDLARDVHAAGPLKLRQMLVEDLRALDHRGDLRIRSDRFELAVAQFVQLCCALIIDQQRMGLKDDITLDDIRLSKSGAIEMFLCRYGNDD